MRVTSGGSGSPQPFVPGVGVGSGSGVGVGEGPGVGVAFGVGDGLGVGDGVAPGIFGIGTFRIGDDGVSVGWVGVSSVIVWHPSRMSVTAVRPQPMVFITIPST
jgi:hypothetical protein